MGLRRLAITIVGGATLTAVLCTGVVALLWAGEDGSGASRPRTAGAGLGGPTQAGRPEVDDPGYEDEASSRSREGNRARRGGGTEVPSPADLPSSTPDPRDGGHPPAPTRSEQARATEFLLADPPLAAIVRRAYAEAAHRPLTSAADLRVRSLIFRRFGCETRRCLQLFVWFPNGEELDIGRIVVDMSSGGVRVLRW
ncbi:hypothetical protein [Sphaerisporangium perillae]|uniref:hypothetical protein n=1 Tax=Sphaerisporangium perillae TaxID=2935860 RepID=UPI002010255C|nr:hypothetical protein [Sphaerisporangium perillae]